MQNPFKMGTLNYRKWEAYKKRRALSKPDNNSLLNWASVIITSKSKEK